MTRSAREGWEHRVASLCVLTACLPIGSCPARAKESSTLYPAERVANARRNVERYAWAAQRRDAAVAAAEPWAALTDEQLWELVPEQALPRTAVIASRDSCPKCRAKADRHGPYAWKTDLFKKPWKVTCPECGQDFPTNDFGEYYASGKGPGYLWEPGRSDRSLLKAGNPAARDPYEGVDDGFGYVDADGQRHAFIAYYCHWGLWRGIQAALMSLSEAYLLTGEPAYAHKAAVLLCRLGDLYPAYDHLPLRQYGFDNSSGGTGEGKIYGRIWETGVCSVFIIAADRVWEAVAGDELLLSFLEQQSIRHELPDAPLTAEEVQDHLIHGVFDPTIEGLLDGRIYGSAGSRYTTMARVAIALDDPARTPKLLDWIFLPRLEAAAATGGQSSGGGLPAVLVGAVDRDGVGPEGAPDYALGWTRNLRECADLIADYGRDPKHDLYRDFPKLRQMFLAPLRLAALGRWTPNIGNTGRTGANRRLGWDLDLFLAGFRRYRDPRLAQAVRELNGGAVEGLHTDLFDADPEAIKTDLEAVGGGEHLVAAPRNMAGYGLALLESGKGDTGRALWLHYGRSLGQGHRDRLNLGLFAHGLNLLPDLGYPEFVGPWPKCIGWTSHTVSHNTVMVDRQPQRRDWGGTPVLFKSLPGLSLVEVESAGAYPQCQLYRRQCALIDVDVNNAYAVDVFRVAGGSSHVFSFHAAEGEPRLKGLRLQRQETGTLAGEDTPLGDWSGRQPDWSYDGPGFHYLYEVRRGPATPRFSLDWPIADTRRQRRGEGQVHLRLTMLGQKGDAALASGDPPQNKEGNPRRLRYFLLERTGEALTSQFVSVIEPYVGEPIVQEVERLPAREGAVALRLVLGEGRVDYVYSSLDPRRETELTDDLTFAGRFAHVRLTGDKVISTTLVGGALLRTKDLTLTCEVPEWTGTIDSFDLEEDDSNCLYTASDLPARGTLDGQWIYLDNDGARNAAYQIREVRREAQRTVIDLGDVTFVREFKDNADYGAGVVHNFEPGCAFSIPNHVRLVRSADGIYRAEFTAPVRLRLPSRD